MKAMLFLLAALSSAALADPNMAPDPYFQSCFSNSSIYWHIATDMRNGLTLRSAVDYRLRQLNPTPQVAAFVQQAIEAVYNQPLVTPDTWFGYELAVCEAAPPKSPFTLVPAPNQ
jgi:hypothetical protein